MEEALEQRKTADGELRSEPLWKGVLRQYGGIGKGSVVSWGRVSVSSPQPRNWLHSLPGELLR